MKKTMDDGFPRMAKFVTILPINIVRLFFNFKDFLNDT
jgi:hypothetical protein